MSLATDFDQELHSIETRFTGGLSNTSTKKFDDLIKIVSEISGVEQEKIYITAATSRASNLWNRLAQGKPLTQHFSFALGIIDAEDLQGGISPASRFIGEGVGHYDAIALAVKRSGTWVIGAVLDSNVLSVYDKIAESFPGIEISHEVKTITADSNDSVSFAWYVGTTGNDSNGEWRDYSDEYIEKGIWVNGWDDKFVDMVNSIEVGDRIAIKSTFTQKKNLPFENHGKTVGAMKIKAIGVVTENPQNGKDLKVDWTKQDPVKIWFGPGTLRETIHRVAASDGYIKRQLLEFTFGDKEQDYSICEERYSNDTDLSIGVDEASEDESLTQSPSAETDITEKKKKISCLDVSRKPRESKFPALNRIIYGAPGTGKTHATVEYALAIIENREIDNRRKNFDERKAVIKKYNDYVRKGQVVFTTFHQSYGYEEFIQGLRPDTNSEHMSFITVDGVFKRIADAALIDQENNYVIVIDEINRANISKVFGELITLIEDDKRWGEVNETCATLQSGDVFAVPNNLYIVGTMNSADKSISLIDAALRRRFEFIEQRPDANLIDNPLLKAVFNKINVFLADSLESSDLLVGHSYFMNKTEADLCTILNNCIIPLLYEYYYDNKKKVIGVLTDALKGLNVEIKDPKISRVYVVAKEVVTEA